MIHILVAMAETQTLKNKRIVCLGGGSGGTSTLLRSLKETGAHLTSITSMADDGGSSGRLRKAYGILPPGNLVSCIASLVPDEYAERAAVLMHRFPGSSRENKLLGGHKLGNLIMLAEMQRTGDIYKAVELTKQLLGVTNADILPATDTRTRLTAITKDGRRIHGETTLDLTLYSEPHGIKKVFLTPKKPQVNERVVENLKKADIIISGPGDLYTNQLPVLIIPQIKEAILQSRAKKIFIANIANKPFETKNYSLGDFVEAIREHLGLFPFDTIIANNNQKHRIPKKYRYKYIPIEHALTKDTSFKLLEKDLVEDDFPIHHDPKKLASAILSEV